LRHDLHAFLKLAPTFSLTPDPKDEGAGFPGPFVVISL
jgi:hypothetical protein